MKRIVIAALLLVAIAARADESIPLASDVDDCQTVCSPAPCSMPAACQTNSFNVHGGAVLGVGGIGDQYYEGFLRFLIPPEILQASITSARLVCNGTNEGAGNIAIRALLEADATTAPELGGNPGTTARTTASVACGPATSSCPTNTTSFTPDIKSVYNEWLALGGTSASRYIIIVLDRNGLTPGNDFYCMDMQNPAYGANQYTRLDFSFVAGTPATATPTPTNTSPPATATPLTTPTRLPTYPTCGGGATPCGLRCGEITH